MRLSYAIVPAAIPVIAVIAGLPFVNRLDPVILGMPLLLAWTLGWVLATPAFLALAYVIVSRSAGKSAEKRS